VKVAVHTTSTAVTGSPGSPTEVWTDYSGTAVFCAFAGIAALNTLVTVLVGRGGDLAVLQLAGGTRRRLKLDLPTDTSDHRRVLAVLRFLEAHRG
jgi:putative ABC transport system permease protein